MKGHNSNKKEKISATLMTGIILAGVMTGSIVNVVNGVGQGTSVQAKELNETVKPQTASSEKTTEKSTSIKTTKEETTKEVANKKEATKAITKKDIKETTRKTKSAVPAAGYVGPSQGAINTQWSSTDVASNSKNEYVSPTGGGKLVNGVPTNNAGKADNVETPVLYFGNAAFNFQPSALTNNKPYSESGNASSWAFTKVGASGRNPNPRKSYGIIINNTIPNDRGYGYTPETGTTVNTIESGVKQGSITEYHLYKNNDGTGFKATMYDATYKVSYTFEEMYDAAGGIYSYFSITNNDTATRAIGATQGVDTLVDTDNVPVKSLGPNNGFKMVSDKHTLNYRLKDPGNNTSLGGWTNYTAGGASNSGIINTANVSNYFTGGILGSGMEASVLDKIIAIKDISQPDTPFTGDSAFVIKANPKALGSGETLTSGSYLTYKETTPTVPPVATATPSTINAYADQTDSLKIEGKVSDEDSTKGYIQIKYPDGSISSPAENTYETTKDGVDYTAKIDPTKLKVGANKVIVTAIDAGGTEQLKPVTVTVNLFKLGATAIPQQIDVGGTVTTDETKLIKDLTIMNTNKHTLEIDSKNPSNKPLDNTKVGFYMQDMILTDTDVTPNETAKVAVPVNVISNGGFNGDSVVNANDFSTDNKDISGLTDAKLKDFILTESSAKGWILSTGADSKVTVQSTTLTPTSSAGDYEAVIENAQGAKITIKITVAGGGLAITAASDEMTFGSKAGVMLPYSGEKFNLQRNAENTVSISNLGKTAWTLNAKVTTPLTDGSNTLKGVLKYIDATGTAQDLDTGAEVGSGQTEETKDVTWAADKGVVAELSGGNTSLKAGKYAGEITWTLTDAP